MEKMQGHGREEGRELRGRLESLERGRREEGEEGERKERGRREGVYRF
jgi:hypothetical protein